jgi:hypothetical protein
MLGFNFVMNTVWLPNMKRPYHTFSKYVGPRCDIDIRVRRHCLFIYIYIYIYTLRHGGTVRLIIIEEGVEGKIEKVIARGVYNKRHSEDPCIYFASRNYVETTWTRIAENRCERLQVSSTRDKNNCTSRAGD